MLRHVLHSATELAVDRDADHGSEEPQRRAVDADQVDLVLAEPVAGADPLGEDLLGRLGPHQRLERTADEALRRRRAEELRERGVRLGHDAVAADVRDLLLEARLERDRRRDLHPQDALGREAHERAVALFASPEAVREPRPLAGVERHRHEVGDRRRVALLVEQPLPRRPDVLVAHHPHQAPVVPDRRLEHRADAERGEVVGGELDGARVAVGVRDGNGAAGFERAEVGRVGRRLERRAGHVLAEAAPVEVVTADMRARLVEQPHARALDLERPPGDLGDAPERLVDRELGDRVLGEELEEPRLLPPHAALGHHRCRHFLHGADETDRLAHGIAEHPALGVEPARDAAHVDAGGTRGRSRCRSRRRRRRPPRRVRDRPAAGGGGRSGSRRRTRRADNRAGSRGGGRGPGRRWRGATPTARCRRPSGRSGRTPRASHRGRRARGRGLGAGSR